ncbi:ABC transporter permease [Thalassospira sp.]|uniref:cell division protein FtsX n=1 Tax=Thalassospira sp. TaxID=1912094 RepID=UPI0027345E5D|nr:cell division protein [Thalassospira sp.]MDP2698820.1 cell division protein [Thalassospira sp.]
MAFRPRQSHLPLDSDSSSRFLPAIVALMVALLTFALVGLTVLQDAVGRWSGQIEGSLTVQIPPNASADLSPEDRDHELRVRVDEILDVLADAPGISRVEELSPETMAALLEPWLGPNEVISELPIPRIIEITPTTGFNFDQLETLLAETAPEAILDDHRIWIERISDVAFSVELALITLIAVLFGATILSVVFATRSGLSIHRNIIELLHLMGAQDTYIAGQFARHSMRMAFWGGILGMGIALPVSGLIGYLGIRAGWDIPGSIYSPWFALLIMIVPVLVALVARITASRTVLKVLRRML